MQKLEPGRNICALRFSIATHNNSHNSQHEDDKENKEEDSQKSSVSVVTQVEPPSTTFSSRRMAVMPLTASR